MAGKAPKEEAIINSAIDLFRTGFPNPERQGCPSAAALRATARMGQNPRDLDVLEHLTCCSPCFAQFERALDAAKMTRHQK